MQITMSSWSELDLGEVARLTCAAKEGHGQPSRDAIDRIAQELGQQFAALPRYAVLARHGEELAGWLMLVVQDPTRVEINPWCLGGHPLVAPGQDRQEVGARLLQAATEWARNESFEVAELSIERDLAADPQVYESHSAWYASLGFHVREESLGFFFRLDPEDLHHPATPEGIELRPVSGVDRQAVYRCYHEAFCASHSGTFLDQSERERRAFFDTFGVTYGLHESTSLALFQEGRIAGFAYTIPFGEHLHLDWIGIHPGVRRRGLGRFLMQWIVERAAREGFLTMGLSCDARNAHAIALYASLGWQQDDAEIKFAAKL